MSAKRKRAGKAGATPSKTAKDGTQRGIVAHRGAPKLTEEALAELCTHIERGRPVETACRLVGVWPSALQQRMAKDEELAERVEQARARSQVRILDAHEGLAFAGERTGGCEFLLERLWPKQFRPAPTKVDNTHAGPDGGAVQAEVRITLADARELAKDDET